MPTARPTRRRTSRLVWRPNSPAAAERPDGFTLIELIVAIVLIGLLAALAVPTFRAVTGRVHDRVALAEMAAVSRHAAALISLDGATGVGFSEEALAASLAGAPEAYASEVVYRTERTAAGFALLEENTSSEQYGDVSWNIADDGSAIGLAMRSRSGRCAWVTGDRTGAVQEGVTDAGPGECVRLADGSTGGDTGGDGDPTPPIDPEDFPYDDIECSQLAPMTAATEECKVPDEDHPTVGDPIDTPAPGGHDPASDTSTFHALTSFVHPSWPAPHRMLVTQPASGRVVMVRQNSNTTPGNASATVFATGLPNASGIVVGPDPSTPAGGGVLVLYPVYVGTSANGGSIVRIQPETRVKTTVATNLGGTPTSLATGARCLTASGSFSSGWCIYATVGDSVKTVNVNNGAVTTIHTADTELHAVQPIAGPALVVTSTDGTHTVTAGQLSGTTPTALPTPTGTSTGGLTWQGNHPAGTQAALVGTWGTRSAGLVGPSGQTVALPDATDVHAHGNLDTLYATAGSCVTRVSWRNNGTTTPGSVRATPSVAPLWCAGQTAPVPVEAWEVTTVAGGPSVDWQPRAIAVASPTLAYVAESSSISAVNLTTGTITLVAGSRTQTGTANGAAADARFASVNSVAVRGSDVLIADGSGIRRLDTTTGTVSRPVSMANWGAAGNVAVNPSGRVVYSTSTSVGTSTAEYDPVTWTATTLPIGSGTSRNGTAVAANDTHVFTRPGGSLYARLLDAPAEDLGTNLSAGPLNGTNPKALAVHGDTIFTIGPGTHQVGRMQFGQGPVRAIVGGGSPGFVDGVGQAAWFNTIQDLDTLDGQTLYVVDGANRAIRRVSPSSYTVTQPPAYTTTLDIEVGQLDTVANSTLSGAQAATVLNGTTYVATTTAVYRRTGSGYTPVAGSPTTSGTVDSSDPSTVRFSSVYDLTNDGQMLYLSDGTRIRRVDPATGATTTLRTNSFAYRGVAVGPDGYLYALETTSVGVGIHRIDLVSTATTSLSLNAGTSRPGHGIAVDATHVYARVNGSLRRVRLDGTEPQHLGSAGNPTNQTLISAGGYLYYNDTPHSIARTPKSSFAPTRVAGGVAAGDRDGTAFTGWMSNLSGLAHDGTGLTIVDRGNDQLRRLTPGTFPAATQTAYQAPVTIPAATSATVVAGSDGLTAPSTLTVLGTTVYVMDGTELVRFTGSGYTTVAGVPGTTTRVDADSGANVRFAAPTDMTNDGTYLYVTDQGVVRVIDPATGATTTLWTSGTAARGIAVGPDGYLYFTAASSVSSSAVRLHRYDQTTDGFGLNSGTARPGGGLAIDATRLYVRTGGGLYQATLDGNSAGHLAGVGGTTRLLVGTRDHLYVSDGGDLRRVDKATGALVSLGVPPGTIGGLATDGTALIATDQSSGRLLRYAP